MNDIRKKFLESIYVSTENYPASFYEKIQNIPLSSIETEYCAVPNYCDGKKEEFHIRDLIGTNHERYVGKTWIEAYLDLDRGNDIIQLYNKNPNYYKEIREPDKTDLGLIKLDRKYYIFDKAGGGNNRLITMKIMYLSQMANNKIDSEKTDEMFTFSARVREIPKDRDLPYIIMALGEDLGFGVNHSNGTIKLTKKFSDDMLFEGNSDDIKQYFLSLFDTDKYDSDLVKQRLNNIRRTFSFSGKQYQEKLEQLIPNLREE